MHPHDLRWIELRRLRLENAMNKARLVDKQLLELAVAHEKAVARFTLAKQEHANQAEQRRVAYEALRERIGEAYGLDFASVSYDDESGRLFDKNGDPVAR